MIIAKPTFGTAAGAPMSGSKAMDSRPSVRQLGHPARSTTGPCRHDGLNSTQTGPSGFS